MLTHLLTAAIRSLAVTVVLGSILIYATGGLDSPSARGMIGVVAACFFLFWITFFFIFGSRKLKHQDGRDQGDGDGIPHLAFRRHHRENDESESEASGAEHGVGSD